jgi:hypothetical protein
VRIGARVLSQGVKPAQKQGDPKVEIESKKRCEEGEARAHGGLKLATPHHAQIQQVSSGDGGCLFEYERLREKEAQTRVVRVALSLVDAALVVCCGRGQILKCTSL